MSKDLKIRRSYSVNALPVSTGAFDVWGPSRHTTRASNVGSVTRRLKRVPISLPPVPIKDTERSEMPIEKLLEDPDQEWSLEDIEQSIIGG
jgi:hypothetical protein